MSAGASGVFRPHRVVIADRQERNLWRVHVGNESHVTEERRVAGEVEGAAVLHPDDEARRLSEIDDVIALDDAAAVHGGGHRNLEAGDGDRPANTHPLHVLQPLVAQPLRQLVDADDRRPGRARDADDVR